ncbi:hypothetical protein [Methylomagnum ishizawai]|uniref:hypothetical protein n=1 Tax=Methylomagnum ishizawai TaxID=1760988 RepID=UPI001C823D71|nr:hypothetical protein [Methylomagnum ishizawai]
MKADVPSNAHNPGTTLPENMRIAYRIALLCGGIPLLIGCAIFSLWLATNWNGLIFAGVLMICGGWTLFLEGLIVLGWFYRVGSRLPNYPRRRLRLSTLGATTLLLSNFPAAWAIFTAATTIIEHHRHD